jgi:mono/diheme cytochrome c family protein
LHVTEKRQIGETVYVTFCAGCHGFDGYASYPNAPSFALGEALQRSDSALIASILDGKDTMPAWRNNLSPELARATISYIRTNLDGNTAGITRAQQQPSSTQQTAGLEGTQVEIGGKLYLRFCGGCHGFNGIAWYVNSPSFALNERMNKRDQELANSIRNGRGEMPSWEFMLKPEQIDALVLFIRTLSNAYENGIASKLRSAPELFFRFRPRGVIAPEQSGGHPLDF